MTQRFGLPKNERLKSTKQIDDLFANGKSFNCFPVRASYKFSSGVNKPTLQIGVTASKRSFKKAVDRNRIKRLLREAYRLQKEELLLALNNRQVSGIVFFIYTDKTIASFATIKEAMGKCLKKLTGLTAHENLQ